MMHQLYEIWLEDETRVTAMPWRAKLVNYVAYFPTKEAAERYVESVKVIREAKK